MARPRKALLNQVVYLTRQGTYGVVVDYLSGRKGARYVVVRTDPIGRVPYGKALWVDSGDMVPQVYKNSGHPLLSKVPGIVYRGNQKLDAVWGDRPCECQCCIH